MCNWTLVWYYKWTPWYNFDSTSNAMYIFLMFHSGWNIGVYFPCNYIFSFFKCLMLDVLNILTANASQLSRYSKTCMIFQSIFPVDGNNIYLRIFSVLLIIDELLNNQLTVYNGLFREWQLRFNITKWFVSIHAWNIE